MSLYLKIFLKILKNEIGFKGILILVIATLLIGVSKEPEKFYVTSFVPGIIFIGFLFEFRRNNEDFFHQFLYLPTSIYWVKLISTAWSLLFVIYIFIFYAVVHRQVPLDILIASFQIFIVAYMVSSYILLRYSYFLVVTAADFITIYFLSWHLALPINTIIMLLSFYPFRIRNTHLLKSFSRLIITDASNRKFHRYHIDQTNYILKFLYITINNHNVHKVMIKLFLFFLAIATIFVILIINQENGMRVVHFLIFTLPLILIIILTYFLILLRKLRNQSQFNDNFHDIKNQLFKIYSIVLYSVIILIFLSVIFSSGITYINIDFIFLFITLCMYANASFLLLFISDRYILNAGIALLFGIGTSILPGIYQLIITLILTITAIIYSQFKRMGLKYAAG